MKIFALVALTLLTGLLVIHARPFTAESMQQQIVAKEREELEALKTGDANAFANLIADEAVFADSRGTAGKAEVVQHISDFKLKEYSIEDVKFVAVSETSGVIAYKLTQSGTSHGHDFTAHATASALWTRRDGKWLCLFSQETPTR